ncbi:MAG TPA: hypothetical protein VF909_00540 [Roseiflexaceae bacterium]
MPTPDDEPTNDDRPTTNIGGDLIGGNQINAQGSQGDLAAALPLIEEAELIAERIGMPVAMSNRAHLEDLRARMGGAG